MSYETLADAVKSINSRIEVISSPPGVLFMGGYYDGDVDINAVESLLSSHGFKRLPQFRTLRVNDRHEESEEVLPVPIEEGEFRLWPTYLMRIDPL